MTVSSILSVVFIWKTVSQYGYMARVRPLCRPNIFGATMGGSINRLDHRGRRDTRTEPYPMRRPPLSTPSLLHLLGDRLPRLCNRDFAILADVSVAWPSSPTPGRAAGRPGLSRVGRQNSPSPCERHLRANGFALLAIGLLLRPAARVAASFAIMYRMYCAGRSVPSHVIFDGTPG